MPDGYDKIGQDTATGQWYGKVDGQWQKITAMDAARKLHATPSTPAAPVAPAAPATSSPGPFTAGFSQASGFKEADPTLLQMAGETLSGLRSAIQRSYAQSRSATGENKGTPIVGTPFANALTIPNLMENGIEGMARGVERGVGDVLFTPGKRQFGAGELLAALSQVASGTHAPDVPLEVADTAAKVASGAAGVTGKTLANAGRELIGSGSSMERLQAAKDINALPFKASLASLDRAARTDASSLIESAISKIDADHPNGVVSKARLGPKVDSIVKGLVKIEEKPPQPIPQVTEPSELAQASVFRGAGGGDIAQAFKSPNSRYMTEATQRRLNAFLEQAGEAPQPDEGNVGDAWTARQVQQLRTKVYNVAYGARSSSVSGAMRSAAREVYGTFTDALNKPAEESGVKATLEAGNRKWQAYKETFDGKWDRGKFNESPISEALKGQTANEIMEPLTGKNAQWTRDLLQRYSQFGASVDQLRRSLSRHAWLSTVERISHPSKYEMAATPIAVLDPTFFARLAATRLIAPPLLRWMITRGIDPKNVRGLTQIAPGPPQ